MSRRDSRTMPLPPAQPCRRNARRIFMRWWSTLSPPNLPPQLPQQSLRIAQAIVENPTCDIQQRAEQRVAQRVANGRSFLARRDDALVAKNGQLLRHDRLVERQFLLQFLDGAFAPHEYLPVSYTH